MTSSGSDNLPRSTSCDLPDSPKINVVAEFACPFCGGDVTVGETRAEGNAVCIHTVPTCRVFDDSDPGSFVHACHRAKFGEVGRA